MKEHTNLNQSDKETLLIMFTRALDKKRQLQSENSEKENQTSFHAVFLIKVDLIEHELETIRKAIIENQYLSKTI